MGNPLASDWNQMNLVSYAGSELVLTWKDSSGGTHTHKYQGVPSSVADDVRLALVTGDTRGVLVMLAPFEGGDEPFPSPGHPVFSGAPHGESLQRVRESDAPEGPVGVLYQIPGKGWKQKEFPNEKAAQKFCDALVAKEGDDIEFRWSFPRRESRVTRAGIREGSFFRDILATEKFPPAAWAAALKRTDISAGTQRDILRGINAPVDVNTFCHLAIAADVSYPTVHDVAAAVAAGGEKESRVQSLVRAIQEGKSPAEALRGALKLRESAGSFVTILVDDEILAPWLKQMEKIPGVNIKGEDPRSGQTLITMTYFQDSAAAFQQVMKMYGMRAQICHRSDSSV